jgi:plasmid maintenance system antidote protein VapI
MATNLTLEALMHLDKNDELQKKIAPFMGVQLNGVQSAIIRKSRSLTTYNAVLAIAESLGKKPDEILEELP